MRITWDKNDKGRDAWSPDERLLGRTKDGRRVMVWIDRRGVQSGWWMWAAKIGAKHRSNVSMSCTLKRDAQARAKRLARQLADEI